MPRESRVQLNKQAIERTELGTLDYKATTPVDMPTITPLKSSGQSLAEGIGIIAKEGVKIMKSEADLRGQREAVMQRSKGNVAGLTEAKRIISEAQKLPIADRRDFMFQQMENYRLSLNNTDALHADYFDQALRVVGNELGKAYDNDLKDLQREQDTANELALVSLVNTDLEAMQMGGEIKGVNLVKMMQVSPTGEQLGKAKTGELYVRIVGQNILEAVQNDPTFDYKTAINQAFNIEPTPGVNYQTHPVYGQMIRTIEGQIETIRDKQYSDVKKYYENKKTESDRGLTTFAAEGDVVGGLAYLEANKQFYTLSQYNSTKAAIKASTLNEFDQAEGDAATYAQQLNSISDGTFTLQKLLTQKSSLTKTQYDSIIKASIEHEQAATTTAVATAKDTFKNLLTVGKGNARGGSIFGAAGPESVRKVKYYTQEMIRRRNEFVTNYGWKNLTSDIVNQWDQETMNLINANKESFENQDINISAGSLRMPSPANAVAGAESPTEIIKAPNQPSNAQNVKYQSWLVPENRRLILNDMYEKNVSYNDFINMMIQLTGRDLSNQIPEEDYGK